MDISWWLNHQFNTWNRGWHLTNICFSYVLLVFFFVPSFAFGADVVAYGTHVPSFADSWGWVMVCKKIYILHTFFIMIICDFFFYKTSVLNSGFRPTNIDWWCGNGQKNWSKNKRKIALPRWCLVPFIYHHE